ncbi:hypothetical protein [Persicobacter diffluens]|uniref:Uncharacterized protein n=1 Tax=Persicobacter diffluens TaxID=981 RepID=A0AAN4VWI3_9BACT|nr:hypothetical protein PEDI_01370 [Persicobacter diffluens]
MLVEWKIQYLAKKLQYNNSIVNPDPWALNLPLIDYYNDLDHLAPQCILLFLYHILLVKSLGKIVSKLPTVEKI